MKKHPYLHPQANSHATSHPNPHPRSKTTPIIYVWKGIDQTKNAVSGRIESNSLNAARVALIHKGIKVSKIHRHRTPPFRYLNQVTTSDIVAFSRQLAVMISAGIPLAKALKGITNGNEKPAVSELLTIIRTDIESGTALSDAMALHPEKFSRLYVGLVRAGEESGTLDIVMDNLASSLEKHELTKRKIRSALFYPTMVLLVSLGIVSILLVIVIPEFESLFTSFGAELPSLTQFVLSASHTLTRQWTSILSGILILFASITFAYKRFERPKFWLDKLALSVPVFGKIHQRSVIARITSILAIMLSAGVTLTNALETISSITGNRVYERGLLRTKSDLSEGKTLTQSLSKTNLFPSMVIQMISTGEESGDLGKMLTRVATFYEYQIDITIESIGQLIEPFLILFLGVFVGTIVIAMYLPVFQSGTIF